MSNLDINIIYWSEAAEKLKSTNKSLHDLIAPINKHLESEKRDYFYQMEFKFGEAVIKEGQMIALEKENGEKYLNKNNVKFTPEGFSGEKQNDFIRFVEDCEHDTDHPLSIVTNNYIEIYCTKYSSLHSVGEYSFPLNVIKQGDLFGVWGSVNSMCNVDGKSYYPWNAVAGTACIVPLFPEPAHHKSSEHYRRNFSTIFCGQANPKDGIIQIANDILGSTKFAEIIIFPKIYYTETSKDDSILKNKKFQLREYLFKTAWEQTKATRDMPWNDRKLVKSFESNFKSVIDIKGHVFAFNFAKHLLNVANGHSFVLKPVSNEDGLLFKVFENLVKSFACHFDKKSGSLLDYTTPVFLHYTKLNQQNPKGIELTHSPSINLDLPDVRLDVMNDIMRAFIDNNRMENILKDKDFKVTLKYFKENGKYHANNIDDYIESELIPLYDKILLDSFFKKLSNGDRKVKLPKSPSLFNSFLQIEKIDSYLP